VEWQQTWFLMSKMWEKKGKDVLLTSVLRSSPERILSHWHRFDGNNHTHPHQLQWEEWADYVIEQGSLYINRFGNIPIQTPPNHLDKLSKEYRIQRRLSPH
jgi:hypothetical protein